MATQKELMDAARQHDPIQNAAALGKAIVSATRETNATPVDVPHVSTLQLVADDEDPFGGNINNRNVAERVAKEKNRFYVNASRPIHTGDPSKARADIAKSRSLNPDPPIEVDDDDDLPSKAPTPGSPAALRQAAVPATPGAPAPSGPPTPTWKP